MRRWERGLYPVLNAGVGWLLRSPLHGLVSGRIMLLTIIGRRSGRSFTVPAGYLRCGEGILSFTSGEWSAWWKNLRGGTPVTARVRGRRLAGSARSEAGGEAVVRALDAYLAAFTATARRYGVGPQAPEAC